MRSREHFYDLRALGLVVLAVHRVGSRHHATASVQTSMDARLSDGHRLLFHDLQCNRHSKGGSNLLTAGQLSLSVRFRDKDVITLVLTWARQMA